MCLICFSLWNPFAVEGECYLRLKFFCFLICLTWFSFSNPFAGLCKCSSCTFWAWRCVWSVFPCEIHLQWNVSATSGCTFGFFWRSNLCLFCLYSGYVLLQVALCLLLDVSNIAFFFCARHIGVLWWACGTAPVVCPRLTTSEILFIALLWVYFRLHFLYFRCNKHVFSFRIKLQARVSATPGCAFYAFRCD